jgi:para-nitrobenzyl esterase
MHRAWVNFATNGDCGWPKYELRRRQTMHFDTTSRAVGNPLAAEIARWKGVR